MHGGSPERSANAILPGDVGGLQQSSGGGPARHSVRVGPATDADESSREMQIALEGAVLIRPVLFVDVKCYCLLGLCVLDTCAPVRDDVDGDKASLNAASCAIELLGGGACAPKTVVKKH